MLASSLSEVTNYPLCGRPYPELSHKNGIFIQSDFSRIYSDYEMLEISGNASEYINHLVLPPRAIFWRCQVMFDYFAVRWWWVRHNSVSRRRGKRDAWATPQGAALCMKNDLVANFVPRRNRP